MTKTENISDKQQPHISKKTKTYYIFVNICNNQVVDNEYEIFKFSIYMLSAKRHELIMFRSKIFFHIKIPY